MLTKYADAEIVDFQITNPIELRKTASFEHIPEDRFRTKDGYLYVKVRAISSRVNKNHDGWPVNELAGMKESAFRDLQKELDLEDSDTNKSSATKIGRVFTASSKRSSDEYGYKTFIGRPIFIDHNNSDPRRARGVVVDSILHIEPTGKRYSSNDYWSSAPDNHKPETHIELLLEVDGKSFPKLAKAIKDGKVNAVSMGANVTHTICNICQKEAKTVEDYCSHIKKKGINYTRADGTKTFAYEDCYNPNFFEISFVFDPADTTATFSAPPITASVNKTASYQELSWPNKKESSDILAANVVNYALRKNALSLPQPQNKTMNQGQSRAMNEMMPPMRTENQKSLIAPQKPGDLLGDNNTDDQVTNTLKPVAPINQAENQNSQPTPMQPTAKIELKGTDLYSSFDVNYVNKVIQKTAGDWGSASPHLRGNKTDPPETRKGPRPTPPTSEQIEQMSRINVLIRKLEQKKVNEIMNLPWDNQREAKIEEIEEKYKQQKNEILLNFTEGQKHEDYEKLSKKKTEKKSSVNLVPPEGVRAAARRGIQLHAQGKAGDGFESATLTRAHKIANGEQLTPEHVKRMHSFFERHAGGRSKTAPSGEVTPWDVAWAAWGGNAGRTWAAAKVKELKGSSKTSKSKCQCWDGYKRVPGTKPCAPGSCEKCDSHRKKTSSIDNFSYYEGLMNKTFNTNSINKTKKQSTNKLSYRDETSTPSRIDTLRDEANCPFDIRHCGMDNSGSCDVCGFNAPPEGLGGPNIEKARKNLHKIEDAKNNLPEGGALDLRLEDNEQEFEPKDLELLFKEIGKIRNSHSKTLTNTQNRIFNLQTKTKHGKSGVMNKRSQIVLTASVETAPTNEELFSKGWDVVAATPKTPIAEDGKRASNEPQSTRVVSDQLAPVTSSLSKESTMDSSYPTPGTGEKGGNGANATPQFHSDETGGKINESSPMNEHHPSATIGTGSNHPVPDTGAGGGHRSEPQFSTGEQSTSEPKPHGIDEHQPTNTVPTSYDFKDTGPNDGNVSAPQFTSEESGGKINPGGKMNEHHPSGNGTEKEYVEGTGARHRKMKEEGKSREAHLFDAMKLARLEIELGLTSPDNEFNRVAALQEIDERDVALQLQTLSNVKQAGILKAASTETRKNSMTLPSMRQVEASAPTATTNTPDEAIFG